VSLSHEDVRASDSVGDGDESDISSLLDMFSRVTEKRGLQGRVYGLVFVLAASLIAVLAGASNYRQIADKIEDFPPSLMWKLKARWCYFRTGFRRPSAKTVRLVLSKINADQFDAVAGEWLRQRAKPELDGTMTVAIDGVTVQVSGGPSVSRVLV
jgi:hypothetical protein